MDRFLLWTSLILLASTPGCSDDEGSRALGRSGESCQSRADCASGLACIANVCVPDSSSDSGDSSEGSPASFGGRVGGVGESCQKATDCQADLSCIDNVCVTGTQGADAGSPRGGAGVHESCVTGADCAPDLVCVQSRCAIADYPLTPTGMECVLVECQEAADCCPEPPQACATIDLAAVCDPAGLAYNATLCAACGCDESAFVCVNDRCESVQTCEAGVTPCPAPYMCSGGSCVRCVSSADCPSGSTCQESQCVDGCVDDGDCPYFHACQSGACIDVGCRTDRECVATTDAVTARCIDGQCRQPCESDLECGGAPGEPFNFRGCFEGFCTDLGCGTDEECRIRLGVLPGGRLDAVCR